MPGCNTVCSIANHRPSVLGAFSAASCLHASSPFLSCTRCTNLRHREVVNVPNKACSVLLSVRIVRDATSSPVGVFTVGLSVGKKCHASLIHESEVFFHLEPTLMPVLLFAVEMGLVSLPTLHISVTPVVIPLGDMNQEIRCFATVRNLRIAFGGRTRLKHQYKTRSFKWRLAYGDDHESGHECRQ